MAARVEIGGEVASCAVEVAFVRVEVGGAGVVAGEEVFESAHLCWLVGVLWIWGSCAVGCDKGMSLRKRVRCISRRGVLARTGVNEEVVVSFTMRCSFSQQQHIHDDGRGRQCDSNEISFELVSENFRNQWVFATSYGRPIHCRHQIKRT